MLYQLAMQMNFYGTYINPRAAFYLYHHPHFSLLPRRQKLSYPTMANPSASGDSLYMLYYYNPSATAAAIFVVLFLVITLIHTYQMFRTKTWYFLPFVLGGHC